MHLPQSTLLGAACLQGQFWYFRSAPKTVHFGRLLARCRNPAFSARRNAKRLANIGFFFRGRVAHAFRWSVPDPGAVAEFRFQPRRWEAEHRFIMVRRPLPEDPEEAQQLSLLKVGRFAYSAFVTNLELQPWMIWKTYQARANVEKSVRELLQYFSLNKIPTQS